MRVCSYREGSGVDVVPGGLGLAPGDGAHAGRHSCLDRPDRLPPGCGLWFMVQGLGVKGLGLRFRFRV